MDKCKQDFEETIKLICKLLFISDWNIKTRWTMDAQNQSGHLATISPEQKECVLLCNELMFDNEKDTERLVDGVIDRLIEVATCDMQSGLDKHRKMLKAIVKRVCNQTK